MLKQMRVKITVVLVFIGSFSLQAQERMFEEAFEEFATSRFWQYEEIPVTWNMKGTVQANLNEALNNLMEGNSAMAEHGLSDVLKEDPRLWQVYYYRAASRKNLHKFTGAEKDLAKALQLHPDFYEGYVELAKVHHLSGNISESERALKRATHIDNTRPIAFYLKGDINLVQQQTRNAIHDYEECLKADSLFHDARIKLALIELGTKKNEPEALQQLDRVLAYDSLQKTALLFRALLNADRNKKQSVKDLTNLIIVSPNNMMAYYFRGLILTELGATEWGDYDRAFADFRKVIKATSADDNNFAGQQTWLDKKIDLQNAGHYTVSRVYGLPEDDGAKIRQAYCYILIGEYDKSIVTITRTSNPIREPLCIYLQAVAYEHKGQHDMAFKYYSRALELDKDIADAYKKRAIYEQELKQWDRSVRDFTEVLRLTPDAFVIYKMRGTSNFYIDRFKEAISDYSAYLAHDSTNKEIMGYRGMAYLRNKEKLNAYVDFAQSDNRHMLDFKEIIHLIDSVMIRRDTVKVMDALAGITRDHAYFTEGFVLKFKIHMARNEWASIENDIARAVRNSRKDAPKSDHAYLLTLQAMSFARNKHEEDAIRTFDEAIRMNKTNDLAYLERAKVWRVMGKSSKAESDLKQASSLGNKQAQQLLAGEIK
jgi:tetratricopeptide (TPR) repeat protein